MAIEKNQQEKITAAVLNLFACERDVNPLLVVNALRQYIDALETDDEKKFAIGVAIDFRNAAKDSVHPSKLKTKEDYRDWTFDWMESIHDDDELHVEFAKTLTELLTSKANEWSVIESAWELLSKYTGAKQRTHALLHIVFHLETTYARTPIPVDFIDDDEIRKILFKHHHIRQQAKRTLLECGSSFDVGRFLDGLLGSIKDPRERSVIHGYIIADLLALALKSNNSPIAGFAINVTELLRQVKQQL